MGRKMPQINKDSWKFQCPNCENEFVTDPDVVEITRYCVCGELLRAEKPERLDQCDLFRDIHSLTDQALAR